MSNKEKVYSWIDKNQEEVIELLQKLVREPSVKQYMHEGQAQAALKEYLEEMGMETEYSYPDAKELAEYEGKPGYYADHTFEERPNLFAKLKGTGGGKSMMMSSGQKILSAENISEIVSMVVEQWI